jgi:hypothetical protein
MVARDPTQAKAWYLFSVISESFSPSSSSFVLGRFSSGWYKPTSRRLISPFNPLSAWQSAFIPNRGRRTKDDDKEDWDMTLLADPSLPLRRLAADCRNNGACP